MNQTRISSDAVKAKTGNGWDEWFAILDAANARSLPRKEIVSLLHGKHALAGWWAQMVTVGYEQERGLRQAHQQSGCFTANISRTLPFPAAAIYDAFISTGLRERWLDLELRITTSTPSKSVRIAASDRTRIDVNLYPKGEAKTTIQLQHEKLPTAEAVVERKSYWAAALEKLRVCLSD